MCANRLLHLNKKKIYQINWFEFKANSIGVKKPLKPVNS